MQGEFSGGMAADGLLEFVIVFRVESRGLGVSRRRRTGPGDNPVRLRDRNHFDDDPGLLLLPGRGAAVSCQWHHGRRSSWIDAGLLG